jgi:hypothetical protein
MNIFEKKAVEKIWWYGLNILTTLLIISLVNVNGPKGDSGLPGRDGVDGEGASTTYPVTALSYEQAPTGTARAAYAQSLVQKGYIPLGSVEDFSIFTTSPDAETDVYAFGNLDAYDNKKYVLTADIDFADVDTFINENFILPEAIANENRETAVFEGIFDGAGYTIKNFSSQRGEYDSPVGFFPYTGYAQIKNVTFENVDVSAIVSYNTSSGVVVGAVYGPTLIQNVNVTNSTAYSEYSAGGVVGRSEDHLYLVNVKTDNVLVGGQENAGGMVGFFEYEYDLFIQDSVSNSTIDYSLIDEELTNYISEYRYGGGLVGRVDDADSIIILNSANLGDVITNGAEVGGLIGFIADSQLTVVANSFNSGFVQTYGAEAGGLIGDNNSESPFFIQNSFNAGQIVSAGGSVGGLIGEVGYLDEYEYVQYAPVYITNSYNAGHISTFEYSDEKGGLIGQIYSNRRVVISNSFNVGTFSLSITSHDADYPAFADNGAIVGDTAGIVTLVNVGFYVDEANPTAYLNYALDRTLATGVTRFTSLDSFTTANFEYNSTWNFNAIWTFNSTGYAFPVLRNLPTFTVDSIQSFAPVIATAELYNTFDLYDDELEASVIVIDDFWVEFGDVETPEIDLDVKIYATLGETDNLETIMDGEIVQVINEAFFESFYNENEPIVYLPTLGDGTYAFYIVVVDSDDLTAYELLGTYDFVGVSANQAPVPGMLGDLFTGFNGFDINTVFVSFVDAEDPDTEADELVYGFVLAVTGFDFDSWDFDESANGILFTYEGLQRGGINYLDVTSAGLQYNTNYDVTVFVFDGDNMVRYEIDTISIVD